MQEPLLKIKCGYKNTDMENLISMKFYILVLKQIIKDWIASWMLWPKIRKKIYMKCSRKMYKIPNNGIWALFEILDIEEIVALGKQCSFSQWEIEKILLFSGHQRNQYFDYKKEIISEV